MSVGHTGADGTGSRQRVIIGAFFAVAAALLLYPREAAGVEAAGDSAAVAKKQHEITVEAQGLQKKGDFRAALEKVNEAAALSPAGLEPRITRAGILMALERYQDALEDWSVVVAKMEPGSTQTYRLFQYRGLCRLKLGDLPGARADALEAKRLAPKTSDPKELEAIHELVDASTMAQASASPNPADSPASSKNDKSPFATKKQEDLAHEAITLQEKGDLPAALKKANEAVDSFPSAAGPHLARALILMTLERYEDALDDWLIVKTKMEPDEPNAYRLYLNTAQCRWRLGDNAGAEADALEAKRLAPKSANLKELEAIEDLLDASAMAQVFGGPDRKPDSGPDHPIDIDSPEGKTILKKQSELTAEATTLRDKGDFPTALKKANDAVALFGLTANSLLVRATIFMHLGRYKDALEDWDYVIDPLLDLGDVSNADAADHFLYYNRGLCRLKLGDKVGARADALRAKLAAPESIKPDEWKDMAIMLGSPTPLGARWWRTKTENGHQVFSVWELHADGKCAVHSQPYRADGKYKMNDTPSNQAWPGDERTLLGKVTVQGNRWQMTFAKPQIKAGGTYKISADNKTLIGTEDGIEGSFTRQLVDVLDDAPESKAQPPAPGPSPSPVAAQPDGKSPARAGEAPLDYFAWGKEVCSLGRYFFYQQTLSEKEASFARQSALLEKLHLGVSSEFEALARLSRREKLPLGSYATWTKRDQRRWDKNFVPAVAALTKTSNRLAGQTPETDFFYLLGFETYALAVALPENARNRGLRSATTRAELGKGLGAFVWLRENMPANRLTPEVASSVSGLADYKAGSGESLAQSKVDKIAALANAISDAAAAGKLLR